MKKYVILTDTATSKPYGIVVTDDSSNVAYGATKRAEEWALWANSQKGKSLIDLLPIGVSTSQQRNLPSEDRTFISALMAASENSPEQTLGKRSFVGTHKTNTKSATPSGRDFQIRSFDLSARQNAIHFKTLAFKYDVQARSFAALLRSGSFGFDIKTGLVRGRDKTISAAVTQNIADSVAPRTIQRRTGLQDVAYKYSIKAERFEDIEEKRLGGRIGKRIGRGLRAAPDGFVFIDVTGRIDADKDGIVFEGLPLERPIIPRFLVPQNLGRQISSMLEGESEENETLRRAGKLGDADISRVEGRIRELLGNDAASLTGADGRTFTPSVPGRATTEQSRRAIISNRVGRLSRVGKGGKSQIDTRDSRAVEKLTWDDDNKELIVTYNGGRVYTYSGVDDKWVRELENNPEFLGRTLNEIKKQGYPFVQGGDHAPDRTLRTGLQRERELAGMRSRRGGEDVDTSELVPEANLEGADLSDQDLQKIDLSYANLNGADLNRSTLSGASFQGANLSGANMAGAEAEESVFYRANLRNADMTGIYGRRADFENSDLRGADLSGADLIRADFRGADLTGANLQGANLTGAYLDGAILKDANLDGAELDKGWEQSVGMRSQRTPSRLLMQIDKAFPPKGSDSVRENFLKDSTVRFHGKRPRKTELEAELDGGKKLAGADLRLMIDESTNLSGADLRGADLSEQDLGGINLQDVKGTFIDLRATDLSRANLQRAQLPLADMRLADISRAKFAGADLTDADLRGAVANGADFRGVNLDGADLRGAILTDARFDGANITGRTKIDSEYRAMALEQATRPSSPSTRSRRRPTRDPLGEEGFDDPEVDEELKENIKLGLAIDPDIYVDRDGTWRRRKGGARPSQRSGRSAMSKLADFNTRSRNPLDVFPGAEVFDPDNDDHAAIYEEFSDADFPAARTQDFLNARQALLENHPMIEGPGSDIYMAGIDDMAMEMTASFWDRIGRLPGQPSSRSSRRDRRDTVLRATSRLIDFNSKSKRPLDVYPGAEVFDVNNDDHAEIADIFEDVDFPAARTQDFLNARQALRDEMGSDIDETMLDLLAMEMAESFWDRIEHMSPSMRPDDSSRSRRASFVPAGNFVSAVETLDDVDFSVLRGHKEWFNQGPYRGTGSTADDYVRGPYRSPGPNEARGDGFVYLADGRVITPKEVRDFFGYDNPQSMRSAYTGPVIGNGPLPSFKDLDGMTRISGPLGSNGGQWYRDDKTGRKFFVKPTPTPNHAYNEAAVAAVYRAAGAHAPNVAVIVDGKGKPHIISEGIDGLETLGRPDARQRAVAKLDMGIDMALSNWDVFGGGENTKWDARTGAAIRLDTGGGGLYRARGGDKPSFNPNDPWIEPATMIYSQSAQSKYLYGNVSNDDFVTSMRRVEGLDLVAIDKEMANSGVPAAMRKTFIDTLAARQKMAKKYADDFSQYTPEARVNVAGTKITPGGEKLAAAPGKRGLSIFSFKRGNDTPTTRSRRSDAAIAAGFDDPEDDSAELEEEIRQGMAVDPNLYLDSKGRWRDKRTGRLVRDVAPESSRSQRSRRGGDNERDPIRAERDFEDLIGDDGFDRDPEDVPPGGKRRRRGANTNNFRSARSARPRSDEPGLRSNEIAGDLTIGEYDALDDAVRLLQRDDNSPAVAALRDAIQNAIAANDMIVMSRGDFANAKRAVDNWMNNPDNLPGGFVSDLQGVLDEMEIADADGNIWTSAMLEAEGTRLSMPSARSARPRSDEPGLRDDEIAGDMTILEYGALDQAVWLINRTAENFSDDDYRGIADLYAALANAAAGNDMIVMNRDDFARAKRAVDKWMSDPDNLPGGNVSDLQGVLEEMESADADGNIWTSAMLEAQGTRLSMPSAEELDEFMRMRNSALESYFGEGMGTDGGPSTRSSRGPSSRSSRPTPRAAVLERVKENTATMRGAYYDPQQRTVTVVFKNGKTEQFNVDRDALLGILRRNGYELSDGAMRELRGRGRFSVMAPNERIDTPNKPAGGLRSSRGVSRGSVSERQRIATIERGTSMRSGIAIIPGHTKIDDSDGEIWDSLSDEQRKEAISRIAKLEDAAIRRLSGGSLSVEFDANGNVANIDNYAVGAFESAGGINRDVGIFGDSMAPRLALDGATVQKEVTAEGRKAKKFAKLQKYSLVTGVRDPETGEMTLGLTKEGADTLATRIVSVRKLYNSRLDDLDKDIDALNKAIAQGTDVEKNKRSLAAKKTQREKVAIAYRQFLDDAAALSTIAKGRLAGNDNNSTNADGGDAMRYIPEQLPSTYRKELFEPDGIIGSRATLDAMFDDWMESGAANVPDVPRTKRGTVSKKKKEYKELVKRFRSGELDKQIFADVGNTWKWKDKVELRDGRLRGKGKDFDVLGDVSEEQLDADSSSLRRMGFHVADISEKTGSKRKGSSFWARTIIPDPSQWVRRYNARNDRKRDAARRLTALKTGTGGTVTSGTREKTKKELRILARYKASRLGLLASGRNDANGAVDSANKTLATRKSVFSGEDSATTPEGIKLLSELRKLFAEADTKEAAKIKKKQKGLNPGDDPILAQILNVLDLNHRPTVVTLDELTELSKVPGARVIRRGFGGKTFAEDFMDDSSERRVTPGKGGSAQGVGEYWAIVMEDGRDTRAAVTNWEGYITADNQTDPATGKRLKNTIPGPGGAVATLAPDAKVITLRELETLQDELADVSGGINLAFSSPDLPERFAQKTEGDALKRLLELIEENIYAKYQPDDPAWQTRGGKTIMELVNAVRNAKNPEDRKRALAALDYFARGSTRGVLRNLLAPLYGYDAIRANNGVMLVFNRGAVITYGGVGGLEMTRAVEKAVIDGVPLSADMVAKLHAGERVD